jgi:hypothetical protein
MMVDPNYWSKEFEEFPDFKQLQYKNMIFMLVCNMLKHEIKEINVTQNHPTDRIEKDGELVAFVPSGELELNLKVQMEMPSIEELLKQYQEFYNGTGEEN